MYMVAKIFKSIEVIYIFLNDINFNNKKLKKMHVFYFLL